MFLLAIMMSSAHASRCSPASSPTLCRNSQTTSTRGLPNWSGRVNGQARMHWVMARIIDRYRFLLICQRRSAHPDFARIRKNFGPAFGALVAVLKQEALKMSGKQGNHKRHTESDRCVMDHAWEIATAYRESLLGRPAAFADAKPSILELLNRGAASL